MSIFSKLVEHLGEQSIQMKIIKSIRVGSHIQQVTLQFRPLTSYTFEVGSYIQPMIGGCIPRAYSVAEVTENTCTIIVSFSGMGVGARFFSQVPVGTCVNVYGPYNDFPYQYGTGRSKVFLATGTGVAPFIRMSEEAVKEEVPVLLALGIPKEEDIPYRERFEALQNQNKNFFCLFSLSLPNPEWKGAKGYITDQFDDEGKEWLMKSDVYICGVPPMVEGTLVMLKRFRVPKKQIFVQKFG